MNRQHTRRRFLAALGGSTAALAGCMEDSSGEGATTESPQPKQGATKTPESAELDHFVSVEGTEFVVDGSPFAFAGTNNDMLVRAPEDYVDRVFSEASRLGLTAIRTWTFGGTCYVGDCRGENLILHPEPGTYSEAAFRKLDYAIDRANEYGVRLVLPLVNNWDGHLSVNDFVAWSDTAMERDQFYTDPECRALFEDYVESVLTRENTVNGREYREDPGILMWELANEPDLEDNDGSTDIVQGWIEEMGAHVKSVDDNHLLSTGEIGFYDASRRENDERDRLYVGLAGTDYIRNHEPDVIDAAGFHLQVVDMGLSLTEAERWISDHARDAHEVLGKPTYCGEYSPSGSWQDEILTVDRREADWREQDRERARAYGQLHDAFLANDVNGALQWSFMIPFDYRTDAVDDPAVWNAPGVLYPDDDHTAAEVSAFADELRSRGAPGDTETPTT